MKQSYFKKGISLLFIINLFFVTQVFSQQKNELINSGELLKKGNELHDKEEYKKAIDLYRQINRSDTNYSNALYELSFSSFMDKQLDASLKYAELGIKLFPEDLSKFSVQSANALDELGKSEEAIKVYDKALAINPHAYLLHFNKAVTLIKLKKDIEAKKELQNCLLISPYYSSAHYFLGTLYFEEGNLIPALLAYKTYLLIAPSVKYFKDAVTNLNAIAKVTDDVLEVVKIKKTRKEDNFEMLQQILLSKIALDAQYKIKVKLDDKIVRQIQVIDEKLEYKSNDKGFAMQFYVPIYTQLFQDDFEAMIYSMFAGVGVSDIDNWRKKNNKALDRMSDKVVAYLNGIKTTRVLQENERKNTAIKYYYESGELIGKGNYTQEKSNLLTTGYWEFYYPNGLFKAKGTFNTAGDKQGEWLYYFNNGVMKEKVFYNAGVAKGPTETWFVNGNRRYVGTYNEGKINGAFTNYYYNGLLLRKTNYKNDKKQGAEEEYTSDGFLSYRANYLDDEKNGMLTYYFNNGQKKDELNYTKDKAQGIYKSFYKSGKPMYEGIYIDDKKQGLWTMLYENGNVKEKTTYKDDEITGEFTEYYENGKVERKGNYTKKKIDGKLYYYDEDGLTYSDAIYEKGKLIELNFYDKKGNVISNTSTRKGAADITFFSPQGIKLTQGYFNKEGNKEGEYLVYFTSGKVSEKTMYKDGLKSGAHTTYYANGQADVINSFVNDKEDGLTKGYFSNGKLHYEGWVVEDEKQQNIIYYNHKGDIESKNYYLSNELDGYSEYYYPGNVKDCDYRYNNGWLEEIEQFDTLGNVLFKVALEKGKAPVIFKHFNGKKMIECNYENYEINGSYKSYFFDGSPQATSFYKNGNRDSTYKSLYYGGKVQTEGKYVLGQKHGLWKYYYENGKLREEEMFEDGKLIGKNKFYKRDGTLDRVSNYKNNELDGDYTYYAEKEQLALILNYKKNEVYSYTYEDKTGKLVEPIILKGSTGKVTSFFKNGAPSAELNFVNNDVQGKRKFFYSNGNVLIDGTKDLGYDVGIKKTFYANGKVETEESFELGNYNGIKKTYHPNGNIEKEERFYNNELHGASKYFDESGKLLQTRNYYYDNLLSVK